MPNLNLNLYLTQSGKLYPAEPPKFTGAYFSLWALLSQPPRENDTRLVLTSCDNIIYWQWLGQTRYSHMELKTDVIKKYHFEWSAREEHFLNERRIVAVHSLDDSFHNGRDKCAFIWTSLNLLISTEGTAYRISSNQFSWWELHP